MPTPLIKSLAKETGKSESEVEKLWKRAKAAAKEADIPEDSDRFYAYTVGTLKKMLGLKEAKNFLSYYESKENIPGTSAVAKIIENAHNSFIDNLMDQFKLSKKEANHVLEVYKKHKIVKFDTVMGRFKLKHGAFWDKKPIENALKERI